ncbi:hypothetical protein P7K49_005019, partial [Saguinus oedipus]
MALLANGYHGGCPQKACGLQEKDFGNLDFTDPEKEKNISREARPTRDCCIGHKHDT